MRLALALARVHTHAKHARHHARAARARTADVRVCTGVCVFECQACECASVSHPHGRDEGGQPGGLAIPPSGAAAPLERAGMESAGDPGMASSGEANV